LNHSKSLTYQDKYFVYLSQNEHWNRYRSKGCWWIEIARFDIYKV